MLVYSAGQEFGQGTWEWLVSAPQFLGPPLGRPEGCGDLMAGAGIIWKHPYLRAVDADCWLRPELPCQLKRLHVVRPHGLAWAAGFQE